MPNLGTEGPQWTSPQTMTFSVKELSLLSGVFYAFTSLQQSGIIVVEEKDDVAITALFNRFAEERPNAQH